MRNKQARQARIRELLLEEVIETHESLAESLQRHRIEVSQSTLSKDLRELGVARMPRPDGRFQYTVPETGTTLRDSRILERELRDYLINVDRAANMVVVHTLSGHAQSVCEAVDRIGWPEVLGTVAGDNTIFILSREEEEAGAVMAQLLEISDLGGDTALGDEAAAGEDSSGDDGTSTPRGSGGVVNPIGGGGGSHSSVDDGGRQGD